MLFKLKSLVTMTAIFVLGAIMGGSWSGILVSRNTASGQLPRPIHKLTIIEKFKVRLSLSPEQMQRIESILEQAHREFRELHLAVKPQFEEIRQQMRANIRQLLNEGQKQEYEAMLRDGDERRRNRK